MGTVSRWSDTDAAAWMNAVGADEADRLLALRVYTSRLIGSDPDLVMHGGGNTSVKVQRRDVFGELIDVLHVKGSGWDLDTLEAAGLPGVRLAPLHDLRQLSELSDEDMVNMQRCNLLDSTSPNPSVETLLHAYLPHKYVDHTHASAFVALANLPDPAAAVSEIFGNAIALVPYIMPGFQLAKVAADVFDANPDAEGLLLLNHGHFTFGPTAEASYNQVIRHTQMVEAWFAAKGISVRETFTQQEPVISAVDAKLLAALRGAWARKLSEHTDTSDAPMPILDIRQSADITKFLSRKDLNKLAKRGVVTPDHVIRTKRFPLVLDHRSVLADHCLMETALNEYALDYCDYFDKEAPRFDGKKTMLAPLPNVVWLAPFGLIGIGADKNAARIASDLAEQTLKVMELGEAAGGFYPIEAADTFDMEYWSLEQAKLGKSKPKPFVGKIVLVTGGAGAIGLATAQAFAAQGANVMLVDRDEATLLSALDSLGQNHGSVALDITNSGAAVSALEACMAKFGGVDILVSNAGAAWTGSMMELPDEDLKKSFELNFFAHLAFAKAVAGVFETQGRGGQILFNVSKQAVNPGKNFGAYGLPKATTFFLLRQLALELGEQNIRVNGVNADRIRSGLLDANFISARAGARGVTEEVYMAGNLLCKEVEAKHVAQAFVALAMSERTTGHVMTVDGGNVEASLR
ncbi:MAG: bifunctional aldolase/short-chain dehydrogenase [Hyphomicrobiales bacterium]